MILYGYQYIKIAESDCKSFCMKEFVGTKGDGLMQIHTNAFSLRLNALSPKDIPVIQNDKSSNDTISYIHPNISIESMYGGNKEITKEDAILYQYRKDHPLSLFDQNSNQKLINSVSDIPQEYIDRLNDKSITTWDQYRFQIALDFNQYGMDLSSSVDSLAAAYVTALDHLQKNFNGSQLNGYINELETMVSDIKQSMAHYFSNNVGGFLSKTVLLDKRKKFIIVSYLNMNKECKGIVIS